MASNQTTADIFELSKEQDIEELLEMNELEYARSDLEEMEGTIVYSGEEYLAMTGDSGSYFEHLDDAIEHLEGSREVPARDPYAELDVGDDRLFIYDTDNHQAWVQSDQVVDLEG